MKLVGCVIMLGYNWKLILFSDIFNGLTSHPWSWWFDWKVTVVDQRCNRLNIYKKDFKFKS